MWEMGCSSLLIVRLFCVFAFCISRLDISGRQFDNTDRQLCNLDLTINTLDDELPRIGVLVGTTHQPYRFKSHQRAKLMLMYFFMIKLGKCHLISQACKYRFDEKHLSLVLTAKDIQSIPRT